MDNIQQIDLSKTEKWPEQHRGYQVPKHIDTACPHCGKPTFGIQLNWSVNKHSAISQIECASCDKPISYLLVNMPKDCKSLDESNTTIYQVAC